MSKAKLILAPFVMTISPVQRPEGATVDPEEVDADDELMQVSVRRAGERAVSFSYFAQPGQLVSPASVEREIRREIRLDTKLGQRLRAALEVVTSEEPATPTKRKRAA